MVGRQKPAPVAPPPRRSTYVDAVALYETGVRDLQARRFREAVASLRAVIERFPEEKELHERARLYILVCERALAAQPPRHESPDDRVFAATLAINNGQLDQAVSQLTGVVQKAPDHDHAWYMLGVAHALMGRADQAVQHLARSMALNPENRDLAAKEPDLEALRRTDELRALLASPPVPVARRDRPVAKPRRP